MKSQVVHFLTILCLLSLCLPTSAVATGECSQAGINGIRFSAQRLTTGDVEMVFSGSLVDRNRPSNQAPSFSAGAQLVVRDRRVNKNFVCQLFPPFVYPDFWYDGSDSIPGYYSMINGTVGCFPEGQYSFSYLHRMEGFWIYVVDGGEAANGGRVKDLAFGYSVIKNRSGVPVSERARAVGYDLPAADSCL